MNGGLFIKSAKKLNKVTKVTRREGSFPLFRDEMLDFVNEDAARVCMILGICFSVLVGKDYC